jgi:hypothetical protein
MTKTTTTPTTSAGDPGELAELAAQVAEIEPPVAPPGAEPPPPDDELEDTIDAKVTELEEHPERIDELAAFDEQDLADVCQLAFGLAADRRGPHWELPDKSAKRLGKWLKRLIDKYGLEWLKRWLPELATALFLAIEITSRLREDARIAKRKAATGPQPVRDVV